MNTQRSPTRSGLRTQDRWAWGDLALSLVLAVVLLGPMLLRRGYVLRGDMVFVPDQPWKSAWLGLDGRVPRFVPGDAFLSLAGDVLPGDLVQKLVLLLALVAGGCGAGRLVSSWGALPRAAAITLFLWNPWVDERLGIGQWPVVIGYLLLPWVVLAGERVRDAGSSDLPAAWASLVVWLGLSAVFSPASGLVAVLVAAALVTVPRPRVRRLGGVLLVGAGVNLPWILPSLLLAPSIDAPSGQFAAFGARGESTLGVLGSVLSFGGVWKASVVPPERLSAVFVALSLVLTVVGLLGLRLAVRTQRARVLALGVVAACAVGLALVTAVPPVARLLDDVATTFPAVGILRDSHRYLGPAVIALVPGVAAATAWLLEHARPGREAWRALALLVVVAPVLCLPSMAWGRAGDWQPVSYPGEWHDVRELVPPGRTVVLPWRGGYRGFEWNGRRATLDPAPRFFPGEVLIDDRLVVGSRTISSEDPLLRAVDRALASDAPADGLRRLGVRHVLLEKGNGAAEADVPQGEVVHDGAGLRLVDLGPVPSSTPDRVSEDRRRAVVGVDVVVLLTWLGALGVIVARAMRTRG